MDSENNDTIRIENYVFEKYIEDKEIDSLVDILAGKVTKDYQDKKPVFIVVLSGAFIFAADFLRKISFDHDICFVKVKSYEGMKSTGKLDIQLPIDIDVSERYLIILEDIVDSGNTLYNFKKYLEQLKPYTVEIVSLFHKPDALERELRVAYVGRSLPTEFVIGYGLDYNGKGRHLKHLYKLVVD